jgi:hypothetical protein
VFFQCLTVCCPCYLCTRCLQQQPIEYCRHTDALVALVLGSSGHRPVARLCATLSGVLCLVPLLHLFAARPCDNYARRVCALLALPLARNVCCGTWWLEYSPCTPAPTCMQVSFTHQGLQCNVNMWHDTPPLAKQLIPLLLFCVTDVMWHKWA